MTGRDDLFTLNGTTWQRTWVGDNSGRYEWTSDDGRLVCWCSKRWFENGRPIHEYSATLDGYPSTKTWPTLTGVMAAAVHSREAWDRKRAA